MSQYSLAVCFLIFFLALLIPASESWGQRIRFPATPPATGAGTPAVPPNSAGFVAPPVPGAVARPQGSGVASPGAALQTPRFDPFAPSTGGGIPGAGVPYSAPGYPRSGYPPSGYQMGGPGYGYPAIPQGGRYPGNYPVGPNNTFGQPPYSPGQAPYSPGQAPYSPGQAQGIFGGYGAPYGPSTDWLNRFEQGRYLRVVQEIHFRHTWLEGDSANEVDIHDSEVGFTLNWPNFLGSGEPLQLSPTFIFHFWDGPQPPSAADLPSRAYSAFLGTSFSTPRNRNFGGEVTASVGVYTDFNTFTNRSLRVKGTGLGRIQLTPSMQLKFGVSYLNRLDVKLLPVGGLYWQPNSSLELELAFPNPKIRYRLPQLGNTEMFAYVTADYGGDSWTIQRTAGFSDQVDLIDLRVLGGIEFIGLGGTRGFFEAGYAFDRELLYRVTPGQSIRLSDSAILRAGFLF